MPRIKSKNTIFTSRIEFENAVDKAGSIQLQMEKEIAEYNKEKSENDKVFKAKIKKKTAQINELVVSCESYTDYNREALLGDKQSDETKLALFGYRKSPGVIKTLNSKWTLAKALVSLKEAGLTACITVKESINKQAVKSTIPEPDMAAHGLRVDYPEEFWIEPKRAEETPDKKITA